VSNYWLPDVCCLPRRPAQSSQPPQTRTQRLLPSTAQRTRRLLAQWCSHPVPTAATCQGMAGHMVLPRNVLKVGPWHEWMRTPIVQALCCMPHVVVAVVDVRAAFSTIPCLLLCCACRLLQPGLQSEVSMSALLNYLHWQTPTVLLNYRPALDRRRCSS
jgi:hypothetical protein